MRVGVLGAAGRMGREVCRAVVDAEGLELVAAVDPAAAGTSVANLVGRPRDLPVASGDRDLPVASGDRDLPVVSGGLDVLVDAACEVVVDFTRADVSLPALLWCAARGIHAVVGTTGFGADDLDALGAAFAGPAGTPPGPNCILAPNFAIGAVLMMRFAELAAPYFEGAEVIELHHAGKRDAPSGTAVTTAERMAAARRAVGAGPFRPDATEDEVVAGARGGAGPAGIRLHAVRLPGLVAHQEVVLGSVGQTLTVRHDTTDRACFMDGVVLAIRRVTERSGLTIGLDAVLGL
ncbi:MAG: 4-hydroxy-tetrahydrodipicolinate reductase [Acidimicrobiales bacterium]